MAEKSADENNPDDLLGEEFAEDELAKSSGSESDQRHKRQRLQIPSPKPQPFIVQPSPPKFISFDDLMAAASGVRNMSLAHEIAVDGKFKLEKSEPSESSLHKQVKDIVHKAFWDLFEEKINEDPPDFGHAVELIKEVKENLMSVLLPQHKKLKSQIEEVLDLDLIQQKLENEAFEIYYYTNYVLGIMGKLCSPARDDRIAKVREMKEVIPLFKEIFELLDLMKMDMANFTIQQIRPYIQQQSVEYEKEKFDEFLQKQNQSGIDGLELTRHWLRSCFEKLRPGGVTPTEGATQANMATPAAIMNGAYMELLQWDTGRLFPETLVMDSSRFLDLRAQTQLLTWVTSVLLVTYNTVGQSIAGVQSLKVKLKEELCTLLEGVDESKHQSAMENVSEQVNKNIEEFLKNHAFQPRDVTQQNTLKGQITNLREKDNQIIALMSKRVLDFIQQALFSKHTEPLKVPAGMSVMEKELSQICGQFLRLISHNRSVFGSYYANIIGSLLKRCEVDIPADDSMS